MRLSLIRTTSSSAQEEEVSTACQSNGVEKFTIIFVIHGYGFDALVVEELMVGIGTGEGALEGSGCGAAHFGRVIEERLRCLGRRFMNIL